MRTGYGRGILENTYHESHDKLTRDHFEIVCLNHISQIRNALGISGIITEEYTWRSRESSRHSDNTWYTVHALLKKVGIYDKVNGIDQPAFITGTER